MSMLEQNVSPALLSELIRYEAATGKLYWLPRLPHHCPQDSIFSAECLARRWTTRYAGKEALTAKLRNGYLVGSVLDYIASAHRVAWAVANGRWPENEIDHINGVRDDNRLVNLRDVTRTENHRNAGLKINTSGVLGVSWNTERRKWIAQITVDGKNNYLGQFDTITEAAEVRRQANLRFGFHPNHGDRRRVA